MASKHYSLVTVGNLSRCPGKARVEISRSRRKEQEVIVVAYVEDEVDLTSLLEDKIS